MINNPVRKQLPTLENPGTAIDLRSGKSLIAPDGSVVTGTLPEVEQATPSISVSSGGLITASAVQAGGIVADGTKSATQQLTTQGAKTVTPSTSTQTAVASGRYTTGAVQVAGDANLKPENIAEGVSIFGVTGTLTGGAAETVTGTIYGGNFIMGIYIQILYSDSNSAHWEVCMPNSQITVLKNSVIYADQMSVSSYSGGITKISPGIETIDGGSAFFITDNFTITAK